VSGLYGPCLLHVYMRLQPSYAHVMPTV
jgi:hypothetical protein